MQSFLHLEKTIFPVTPQRVAVGSDNTAVSGRNFASYAHQSAFGPEYRDAFNIKGIWLPERDCAWAVSVAGIPAAFRRESAAGACFLFLIHPESESLYQPLLQRFAATIMHFQAVSLSSVRSLLVDIPDVKGKSAYFFVKLSVNRVIGDIVRVLPRKECLSSIGNAIVLQDKQSEVMGFMRDICAFVPAAHHIDRTAICRDADTFPDECGMIVREVPDFLLQQKSPYTLVPFFALFHDNGLLEHMVARSGLTVSGFIKYFLLVPYAQAWVELLFFHHVSIEAHGQNLLWVVSSATGLPCRLMYRDMGGVNLLLTAANRSLLPLSLQQAADYYQDTHLNDATESLEYHWITSVLFNLTKRLVRSDTFLASDRALLTWRDTMQRDGFLCNWLMPDSPDQYRHQEVIPRAHYLRYGYVENMFKQCLIAEIRLRRIPQLLAKRYRYIPTVITAYATPGPDRFDAWFQPFIYTLYSHWLKATAT